MKTIKAFILGMYEFRRMYTTSFNHPDHMRAYDRGREWAHRLTFRRYEYTPTLFMKLPFTFKDKP